MTIGITDITAEKGMVANITIGEITVAEGWTKIKGIGGKEHQIDISHPGGTVNMTTERHVTKDTAETGAVHQIDNIDMIMGMTPENIVTGTIMIEGPEMMAIGSIRDHIHHIEGMTEIKNVMAGV